MHKYSPSTGTCYIVGLHSNIPADVVDIDEQRYETVIANPVPGKVRSHDAQGLPILIDPPALTTAEIEAQERAWRDGELAAQQWLRDRHRDEQDLGRVPKLTADQFVELLGYLQALRDWPQSETFPDMTYRPLAPDWIAKQHL